MDVRVVLESFLCASPRISTVSSAWTMTPELSRSRGMDLHRSEVDRRRFNICVSLDFSGLLAEGVRAEEGRDDRSTQS